MAKATGRTLVELQDPDYVLEDFRVVAVEVNYMAIRMNYRNGEKQVFLTQKIFNSEINWSMGLNMDMEEEVSQIGFVFYLGKTENGAAAATSQKEDSEIILKSIDLSVEEMKALLASLAYVMP